MPTPIHVTIPEPCHENWQQMTPNEQGRHCMSCQKTVVDFTLMSDQEILDYISRASSSVCGRFNNDQLNKTYAERKNKPAFTFRYAWNMIVATFLVTGNATETQAQGKVAVEKKENWQRPPGNAFVGTVVIWDPVVQQVTGVIMDDSTNKPVSYASIRIKGAKAGISANEAGEFALTVPTRKDKLKLIVSAIGYADNEFEVSVKSGRTYKVMMSPQADELAPLVVVAFPSISCKIVSPSVKKDEQLLQLDEVVAGGISIRKEVTTVEKIKRELNEWLPTKKDVRIYPNPVAPGNQVNINLSLGKTGAYKLELMDASGRLVYVQALQVMQQSQVVNVPTQASWSRGVYWVRIVNATDKKMYQAKVLLQ